MASTRSGSTTMRRRTSPGVAASASTPCRINGAPSISTRLLLATPCAWASASTRPTRWPASTMAQKASSGRDIELAGEQALARQALGQDGLDQVAVAPADLGGGHGDGLPGPKVAVEVHLQELDLAGAHIETELEAAVIERRELPHHLPRPPLDQRKLGARLHRPDLVGLARGQVALLGVGAQAARVLLLDDLGGQDHRLAVDRDHRDLDVVAHDEGLDDGVVALVVQTEDGGPHPRPVPGVADAP